MQQLTQPIDRATLLAQANKMIREHEDYIAGMVATDVEQKMAYSSFAANILWTNRGCRRQKPRRYLICLNTWPISFPKNIICCPERFHHVNTPLLVSKIKSEA